MKKKLLLLSLMLPFSAQADICSMVRFDVGADAVKMIRDARKASGTVQLRDTFNKIDINASYASLVQIQNPLSSLKLFEVHIETPERVETQVVDLGFIEMKYGDQVINLGKYLNCQE